MTTVLHWEPIDSTFAYFCPAFSAPGPAGARQQPVQPGLAMNRRGSSVKAVGRWFLTWEWLESLLIVSVLSRFVLYDTFDNTLFKLLGSGNLLIPLWPWFLLLRTQLLARSSLKINAHLWGAQEFIETPQKVVDMRNQQTERWCQFRSPTSSNGAESASFSFFLQRLGV
jgi:hypothetical protein